MTNNLTKRVIAGLLAVMCTTGAWTAAASAVSAVPENTLTGEASEEYVSGDFKYKVLGNGTAEIISHTDKTAEEVIIPPKIDGITVTSLGTGCLMSHKSLTSVSIPDTVETIYDGTFFFCESLKSVCIPSSVKYIGNYVFWGCTSLESIEVSEDNESFCSFDGVLYDTESNTLVRCPENKTSIEIMPGTKNIGINSFGDCEKLTEINLPDTVSGIENTAFVGCSGLERINIPDGVAKIPELAFSECESLKSITLPESVISIGNYAFQRCFDLNDVVLPDSLERIGDGAFTSCTSLEEIALPDSLTFIDSYAFGKCTSLKSAAIPKGITTLSCGVFTGCAALERVEFQHDIKVIKDYAFDGCTALKDVIYAGIKEQWDEIKIGIDNEALKNATVHCTYELSKNPYVTFEKGNGAVKLKWKPVAEAQKYGIAGYVNGKWKLLATGPVTASSYVLKNLKPFTDYTVAVVAMFDGEWEMDFSNAITVSPKEVSAANYPIVTPIVKLDQVRLNWTPVNNAEGYAVAYYDKGWKLIRQTSPDTLSFTSGKLAPGTYYVAVAAKINGKWDTSNIKNRAASFTIGNMMY